MSPPDRLLSSMDLTAFERDLLQAAAGEKPPPDALPRLRKAVEETIERSAPCSDQSAAAPPAPGSRAVSSLSPHLPWPAGLATLGATAGVVAAAAFFGRSTASEVVEPPRPSAQQTQSEAVALPIEPAPPRRFAESHDGLAEETRLIDAARRALVRQRRGEARRHLDSYRRRFPRGMLRPEADKLEQRAREMRGAAP